MRVLASCGLAALAWQATARDILVYSQPPAVDESKVGLGWFSHSEPRIRRNYKHADDILLDTDSQITRIAWWGLSEGVQFDDLSNFDSFTIELFDAVEDSSGAWIPGALAWTESFAIADTSPVPTGRSAPNGALEYRHEAVLSAPVPLQGGVRSFLAISAGLVSTGSPSDAWMWQDAEFHDGWSGVWSWAGQDWTSFYDTDSALELYAVPAPGAVIPFALLCARRRSRDHESSSRRYVPGVTPVKRLK